MKNKLIFIFNSIKQSVINKPFAFVVLIFMFFVMTCCCSIPSRLATTEVRDEYSDCTELYFKMNTAEFINNRIEIGDFLLDKGKKLNHNGQMSCSMIVEQYDCSIKINGIANKIDMLPITFKILSISNDILNNENFCEIGWYLATEYDIAEGDVINIYNTDFIVKKIIVDDNGIYLPYNLQINNWYSFEPSFNAASGRVKLSPVRGYVYGLSHKDMNEINKQLRKFGCKRDYTTLAGLANSIIVFIAMLIIGIVSSTTILWYWLRCNSKKYATYKTLGCSPTLLACTMLIETLLIAISAIGLGLIFDFILSITMQNTFVITGFEWLHYLMLIGGPLVSILVVTIIIVCRRAVLMPANTKYNG